MKLTLGRHLWKFVLSCGGAWLLACSPPGYVDLGGSEVVGRLMTPENQPIAGADVKALKITILLSDPIKYDTVVVASATSTDSGIFKFDSLPFDEYILTVSYKDDSLVFAPQKFAPDPEKRFDFGQLVMNVPGAIRGTVVLSAGGPDVEITCYIAGTSFAAHTNATTSNFIISGIFPVDTAFTVTFSAIGYTRVTVPDVSVKAGDTAVITVPVLLELDTTAVIGVAPAGLTFVHDTLAGTATLTWNSVALKDVNRYIVYDSITALDTVDDTTAFIAIFSNPTETAERTLNIQISALDNLLHEGPRSEILKFVAPPPSWLRITPRLAKVEGRGGVDTAYVAMSFVSKVRTVDSIVWWADIPDSIVQKTDANGQTTGTDTLRWLTMRTAKRLFVTLVDNTGNRWTDSLDGTTLMPIDQWTSIDSLQDMRRYACACAVGGKIYVFGGCSEKLSATGTASLKPVVTVEVFDPAVKEWKTLNGKMVYPRFRAAAAVVENKIYVFGGTNGQTDILGVEEYDPASDTWSTIDSLPQTLVGSAACVINSAVYLTGGVSGTRDNPEMPKTIFTYRPVTRTWGTAGELATPRQLHQAGAIDSFIVVVGGLGYNFARDEVYPLGSIEILSSTGVSEGPSVTLSIARFGFGAAIAGAKVAVFGGLAGTAVDEVPVRTVGVCQLDGSGCQTGADMPAAREGVATASLDGRVYVIGGGVGGTASQKSTRSVYVYYP